MYYLQRKEADKLVAESIDFLPAYDSLDLEVFGQATTTQARERRTTFSTETSQVTGVGQIAVENAGPVPAGEEEEEEGNADVPPEVIESM